VPLAQVGDVVWIQRHGPEFFLQSVPFQIQPTAHRCFLRFFPQAALINFPGVFTNGINSWPTLPSSASPPSSVCSYLTPEALGALRWVEPRPRSILWHPYAWSHRSHLLQRRLLKALDFSVAGGRGWRMCKGDFSRARGERPPNASRGGRPVASSGQASAGCMHWVERRTALGHRAEMLRRFFLDVARDDLCCCNK
jgi:hypothetical protein